MHSLSTSKRLEAEGWIQGFSFGIMFSHLFIQTSSDFNVNCGKALVCLNFELFKVPTTGFWKRCQTFFLIFKSLTFCKKSRQKTIDMLQTNLSLFLIIFSSLSLSLWLSLKSLLKLAMYVNETLELNKSFTVAL